METVRWVIDQMQKSWREYKARAEESERLRLAEEQARLAKQEEERQRRLAQEEEARINKIHRQMAMWVAEEKRRKSVINQIGNAIFPEQLNRFSYRDLVAYCREVGLSRGRRSKGVLIDKIVFHNKRKHEQIELARSDEQDGEVKRVKVEGPSHCEICLEDGTRIWVFVPCGHGCCRGCLIKLGSTCPWCKAEIENAVESRMG